MCQSSMMMNMSIFTRTTARDRDTGSNVISLTDFPVLNVVCFSLRIRDVDRNRILLSLLALLIIIMQCPSGTSVDYKYLIHTPQRGMI